MKTYIGERAGGEADVTVHDDGAVRRLDPRYDLVNHSPDGFEWGYGGSGPAQLSLALCADALGDGPKALRVYQYFKANVIARLPQPEFQMTVDEVVAQCNVILGLMPQEPDCQKCGKRHASGRCPAKN